MAAREPAVGVRQGAAAPLRRSRRRGRVRPRVAGEARRAAAGSASRGPTEYGGRGAGPVEHYIVTEELARARAPELVGRIGVNLVGPTLLAHGTDEQKARWLPHILDASRDLVPAVQRARAPAATSRRCRTRADRGRRRLAAQRPEGVDELRAVRRLGLVPRPHRSRRAEAARASRALVVDMHAPGVEVRPLRQITDESEFNEVFFSDVFVPDDRLVGPEHEGWRIANSTLTHERGVNPRQLVDPRAARRRAVAARRRTRRARRPSPRAATRGGVRRGAAVPAPQLALDLAHRARASTRARKGASTSSGGAR